MHESIQSLTRTLDGVSHSAISGSSARLHLASGISWLGVLTQEHMDEKGKSKNHPICYVSGQFCGSQLNWAALMKEAYVIYMSVRRLSFYVTDADITIRSNHLPLKKFFNKGTMNSKVNNWAVDSIWSGFLDHGTC